MPQSPTGYQIANIKFPAARQKINQVLLALLTFNHGASEPAFKLPFMAWLKPEGSKLKLLVRNAENTAWRDDVVTGTSFPPGAMIAWASARATPPEGWLFCNGAKYPQAAYPELFAAVQRTWNTGGEGPGEFRVPSSGNRAIVGSGEGQTTGVRGGNDSILVGRHHLPNYQLPLFDPGHSHTSRRTVEVVNAGQVGFAGGNNDGGIVTEGTSANVSGTSVTLGGGGQSIYVKNRCIIVPHVIKT